MHHFRGSSNALVDSLQQLALVVNEPDVLVCLPPVAMLGGGGRGKVTAALETVTGDVDSQ